MKQPTPSASTAIHISMTVVLKGKAHKAYTDNSAEVIAALRDTLVGDEPMDTDDFISMKSLVIQPQPQ